MLRAALGRAATRPLGPLLQRSVAATSKEIDLLKQLLEEATAREKAAAAPPADEADSNTPKFQIQTFNAISPVGLKHFPSSAFALTGSSGSPPAGVEDTPHAILLRSHKMKDEEVAPTVRAIARCGAGTNNIPLPDMTKRGIPVFNTPGANANGVKELALCGLFLAARDITDGIQHVKEVICKEESEHVKINARIEKDKSKFAGQEIMGKTLAVLGLGNIGASVAESALALGMNVVGFDPKISVDAAWRLSSAVGKKNSLEDAVKDADFISVNMPYIKGVTHHIISDDIFAVMKPNCHILNFARGEIIDGAALLRAYKKGHSGKYISDFPDEALQSHPKFLCIPHLGASTAEAEDNCAEMAAKQVISFLETGAIKNSVNFPNANLEPQGPDQTRLVIINENVPGVLGEITTLLGKLGVNIAQQLNTSRDSIAYNVVDMQNFPSDEAATELQQQILALPSVISTRLIWTGKVAEGPKNFLTKNMY